MKSLRVALIYNSYQDSQPSEATDHGSVDHLRSMIRRMARAIRRLGHTVEIVPLADDLAALQRKLRRIRPDVVFNQYDDVVHGALYEMRVAAFIRMLGFPMTGSPALSLGLSRDKFMALSLLKGAEIPIPPDTALIERVSQLASRQWRFPLIIHPGQEHAGIGLDRQSVVETKKALREKVREVIRDFSQPVLIQRFLPGREFNVGVIGGRRLRVLPLAEVDYSALPESIPPIMSYAAKWISTSVEYKRTRVICPAKVDPALVARIGEIAAKGFRTIGGWGYGRVDMRLDDEGNPRVLEVNCNPCLDDGMGLARAAKRAGICYSDLLGLVIKAAFDPPPFDLNLPIFTLKPKPLPRGK